VTQDDAAQDDTTQLISAIIELLQRQEKDLPDPANIEFGHRLVLSLGFLLEANADLRELATALGVAGVLESLQQNSVKAPKLASVAKEVITILAK